jgi:hypothetical protein
MLRAAFRARDLGKQNSTVILVSSRNTTDHTTTLNAKAVGEKSALN